MLYFRKAEGARISNMTFLSCEKYNDKDKYKDKYKDKISNRSSFQKYPHTRDYNIVVFAMKQTNTNTESKSDKYEYRKKQKCE